MIRDVEEKALDLGASEFGNSNRVNKRYYVIFDGKRINFGQPGAETYADGASEMKRSSYRARHKKILLKNGTPAYLDKSQPAYWSWNVLW